MPLHDSLLLAGRSGVFSSFCLLQPYISANLSCGKLIVRRIICAHSSTDLTTATRSRWPLIWDIPPGGIALDNMNRVRTTPLWARWIIGFVLTTTLGLSAWRFNEQRKVPLEQIVSPEWWFRHLKGTDLYDAKEGMLFHGNPKLHEVAMTIDDGPNRLYGPAVVSVLHQYNVPATFFLVGVRVNDDPELVRQMVADGDEIANHTYDHQRLPKLRPDQIESELKDDDIDIYKAAHVHTTVMRPPGDEYNDKVLRVCRSLGYTTISWTDAAKDFLNQTPEFISERVLDRAENGSIILLHQDTPYTAQALPAIIQGLRKQGYRFVTINTMLAHLNVEPYASNLKRTPQTVATN